MTACARVNRGELDKLMAVLRRLDAEAAREEARALSPQLAEADEPELMLVDGEGPEAAAGDDAPDFAPGLALRGALDGESLAPEIGTLGRLERFDPSAATIRLAGQGAAMRASEIVIDFDALERELAA